jgi:hypothetical protein
VLAAHTDIVHLLLPAFQQCPNRCGCCSNQHHAVHLEHAPGNSFRHGQGINDRRRSIGAGSQQCALAAVIVIIVVIIIIIVVVVMIIVIIMIIIVIIVVILQHATVAAAAAAQQQQRCHNVTVSL